MGRPDLGVEISTSTGPVVASGGDPAADAGEVDHAVAHHAAGQQGVRRDREVEVADLVRRDPAFATSPGNLIGQVRVPPDVERVDRPATVAGRCGAARSRACPGWRSPPGRRCTSGERLEHQADAMVGGEQHQLGDALGDPFAGRLQICRARQAADHHDELPGAQRRRLDDGAAVVLQRRPLPGGIRCGQESARHRLETARPESATNLAAGRPISATRSRHSPIRDRPARRAARGLGQAQALGGRRVERQPPKSSTSGLESVGGQQESHPVDRRVGSSSRPALSANRKIRTRCGRDRPDWSPPTMEKAGCRPFSQDMKATPVL